MYRRLALIKQTNDLPSYQPVEAMHPTRRCVLRYHAGAPSYPPVCTTLLVNIWCLVEAPPVESL